MKRTVAEYAVRLRDCPSVDGLYVLPRFDDNAQGLRWDGVYFCRRGPLAPSILRFVHDDASGELTILPPKPRQDPVRVTLGVSLLENPHDWQRTVADLFDRGAVPLQDPLSTLQYDQLYSRDDRLSLHFSDQWSLKELLSDARASFNSAS
jgi:hypothetical protein